MLLWVMPFHTFPRVCHTVQPQISHCWNTRHNDEYTLLGPHALICSYLDSFKVNQWINSFWGSNIVSSVGLLSELSSPSSCCNSVANIGHDSTEINSSIRCTEFIGLQCGSCTRSASSITKYSQLNTYQNTAHHTNFQSCWQHMEHHGAYHKTDTSVDCNNMG